MAKTTITGNSAYLWYPGDILMSEQVDELSATEECWYRRALDRSWLDDGLSSDPQKAAKRIGKKCTAEAAEMILKTFFIPSKTKAEKMVNEKQELLRKKFQKTIKAKSKAGIESARKRREKKELERQQVFNGCTTDEPTKSNNTIQYNTIQIKEEKKENSVSETDVSVDPEKPTMFAPTLRDFQKSYAPPPTQGLAIANNKAIGKLEKLSNGDAELCIRIHRKLQAEGWRNGRVDWTTVHKEFNFHKANTPQPKQMSEEERLGRETLLKSREAFYGR